MKRTELKRKTPLRSSGAIQRKEPMKRNQIVSIEHSTSEGGSQMASIIRMSIENKAYRVAVCSQSA